MSRFLKEIPMELLNYRAGISKKKRQEKKKRKQDAYMQAKQAFQHKTICGIESIFRQRKPAKEFGTPKGDGPGYDVGDRVQHVKFGEGTVTATCEKAEGTTK